MTTTETSGKVCRDCKAEIEYLADFPGPRCLKCWAKKVENEPLERPNFIKAINLR
jgi:hypothetical protein